MALHSASLENRGFIPLGIIMQVAKENHFYSLPFAQAEASIP